MIAAFILLILAIGWRLVIGMGHRDDFAWLHNFAPLSAIALCGALALPRRIAFAVPLLAMFVTDLVLNQYYGVSLVSFEMCARYAALVAIAGAGWWLRGHPNALLVFGTSALCSVAFYFLTNTASWITEPSYAKTFAGWSQALTGGLPGYPPTLTFFRNSLISDLLFTAVFVACLRLGHVAQTRPLQAEPVRSN